MGSTDGNVEVKRVLSGTLMFNGAFELIATTLTEEGLSDKRVIPIAIAAAMKTGQTSANKRLKYVSFHHGSAGSSCIVMLIPSSIASAPISCNSSLEADLTVASRRVGSSE